MSSNAAAVAGSVAVMRRVVEGTTPSVAQGKLGKDLLVSSTNVQFIADRLALFEKLYEIQEEERRRLTADSITVTLPDGAQKSGFRHQSTPYDIALGISKGLAEQAIIAQVTYSADHMTAELAVADEDEEEASGCCGGGSHNTQLWDMKRPLEGSCKINFLKFDSPEAQHVFWHSSSHVLGEALETHFGAHLTIGPALERGFYYDSYLGNDVRVSQEAYSAIESQVDRVVKENQPFQRLVLSKNDALQMFKANPFKVALISAKVPDGALTTCYRCGPLVDLCRGPHIVSTGKIKAFSVEKHSSVYWLGTVDNDDLQRVYAISFPDTKLMKQYKTMIEEAKKRDHRVVGSAMNLFFFESNLSPGSCFWLPEGARIYNKLMDLIKSEYRARGFTEVMSPNIFSCDLFRISGHYQNYKENMYCFDVEGKEWALKPMNCPGHCLMFKHLHLSYRQLPIRMADFGVLHRNEISGSLAGLLRVRRFQQDDAHIFCRIDQVKTEVTAALEFLVFIYSMFDFQFDLKLSTRPKKALGELSLWNEAETALAAALDASAMPWTLNPGDGAFYGPKIDIRIQDALQRWHQCGTIQLDFQLPLRFNLQYRTAEEAHKEDIDLEEKRADASWETKLKPGFARPVIIHRAILGSIERMTAVLIEHTAGKFPFWLSPRQIIVCPISEKNFEYARYVSSVLHSFDFDVSVDESNSTVNKKIRQAQLDRWNYVLVVGQVEQESNSVMVRNRDDPNNQSLMTVEAAIQLFKTFSMPSSRISIAPFKPSVTKDV